MRCKRASPHPEPDKVFSLLIGGLRPLNADEHLVNGFLQLRPQADLLPLIPTHRLIEFQPGNRTESGGQTHLGLPCFCSSSTLTSHGMAPWGVRRCSSRRRSNSAPARASGAVRSRLG